jgi:hypothetical protein
VQVLHGVGGVCYDGMSAMLYPQRLEHGSVLFLFGFFSFLVVGNRGLLGMGVSRFFWGNFSFFE